MKYTRKEALLQINFVDTTRRMCCALLLTPTGQREADAILRARRRTQQTGASNKKEHSSQHLNSTSRSNRHFSRSQKDPRRSLNNNNSVSSSSRSRSPEYYDSHRSGGSGNHGYAHSKHSTVSGASTPQSVLHAVPSPRTHWHTHHTAPINNSMSDHTSAAHTTSHGLRHSGGCSRCGHISTSGRACQCGVAWLMRGGTTIDGHRVEGSKAHCEYECGGYSGPGCTNGGFGLGYVGAWEADAPLVLDPCTTALCGEAYEAG